MSETKQSTLPISKHVSTSELLLMLADTKHEPTLDCAFVNDLLDELKYRLNSGDWPIGYRR